MPEWVVWAIVAVAFALGEMLTLSFFLAPIAVAAVLAGAVAALGGSLEAQVAVFVVGSVASLAFLRPVMRRHLHLPAEIRTGTAALVGATAVVLERVDGDGGRVRLNGEVWSARAYDETGTYEPGARVTVLEIDGATALVAE